MPLIGARHEDSNATGINGSESDNSASSSGAVYVYTRSGSTWTQQSYVKAPNTDIDDKFRVSVRFTDNGNVLAVGATGEASNASGVGGDQDDDSISKASAVYLY